MIHNIQCRLVSTLLTFLPAHLINLASHLSRSFFILSLRILSLTEIIHSYIMGIRSYVMGIGFLFCNDFIYSILNIPIVQWCYDTIIAICYGPEKFRIIFIS